MVKSLDTAPNCLERPVLFRVVGSKVEECIQNYNDRYGKVVFQKGKKGRGNAEFCGEHNYLLCSQE